MRDETSHEGTNLALGSIPRKPLKRDLDLRRSGSYYSQLRAAAPITAYYSARYAGSITAY